MVNFGLTLLFTILFFYVVWDYISKLVKDDDQYGDNIKIGPGGVASLIRSKRKKIHFQMPSFFEILALVVFTSSVIRLFSILDEINKFLNK